MRVSAAKHCRTWDPPPAPWNEFAVMGWQVCFQASKRTFHSFSTPTAFPALPGVVRGTFMERDCIRYMNSLFMRRPTMRAAICTRAAHANLRMKRAIVFQLEILRDCAVSHAMEIIEEFAYEGYSGLEPDACVPDAQSDGAVHGDHGNTQSEAGTIGKDPCSPGTRKKRVRLMHHAGRVIFILLKQGVE